LIELDKICGHTSRPLSRFCPCFVSCMRTFGLNSHRRAVLFFLFVASTSIVWSPDWLSAGNAVHRCVFVKVPGLLAQTFTPLFAQISSHPPSSLHSSHMGRPSAAPFFSRRRFPPTLMHFFDLGGSRFPTQRLLRFNLSPIGSSLSR